MKLAKKCKKIYEKNGQGAVITYCKEIKHKSWEVCAQCDCLNPLEDGHCLVCGGLVINNEIIDTKKVTIQTKYTGPTNVHGAKIIASIDCAKIKISVSYNHDISNDQNHVEAVRALCRKMNWGGRLAKGSTKTGFVFVFLD